VEVGQELGFETVARLEAHDALDGKAILEQDEGGQTQYAVLLHDVGMGIDIKGADDKSIAEFAG
jgi:hypothetical protein